MPARFAGLFASASGLRPGGCQGWAHANPEGRARAWKLVADVPLRARRCGQALNSLQPQLQCVSGRTRRGQSHRLGGCLPCRLRTGGCHRNVQRLRVKLHHVVCRGLAAAVWAHSRCDGCAGLALACTCRRHKQGWEQMAMCGRVAAVHNSALLQASRCEQQQALNEGPGADGSAGQGKYAYRADAPTLVSWLRQRRHPGRAPGGASRTRRSMCSSGG